MKSFAKVFAFLLFGALGAFGAPPRFEKVKEHCYYLQLERGNVAAVVTEEGVLMVSPPQDPDLPSVIGALSRITSAPVRRVAFTDPRYARNAGDLYYAGKGAQFIGGTRLYNLSEIPQESDLTNVSPTSITTGRTPANKKPALEWFLFDSQMRVYPSGLEVRILSVRHRARSGGDVVLYVPDEKVLMVGDLYESARFPEIDGAVQGSALEWLDGMKQVVNAIPLLKPAIPKTKPGSKPKQEKTLEEDMVVISSRDVVSTFQNMKDLLEGSQKLQRDVTRAVGVGRSCERFLASSAASPYRSYGNLESYAKQLFETLSEK